MSFFRNFTTPFIQFSISKEERFGTSCFRLLRVHNDPQIAFRQDFIACSTTIKRYKHRAPGIVYSILRIEVEVRTNSMTSLSLAPLEAKNEEIL